MQGVTKVRKEVALTFAPPVVSGEGDQARRIARVVMPRPNFEVERLFQQHLEEQAEADIERHRKRDNPAKYEADRGIWIDRCNGDYYAWQAEGFFKCLKAVRHQKKLALLIIQAGTPGFTEDDLEAVWADAEARGKVDKAMSAYVLEGTGVDPQGPPAAEGNPPAGEGSPSASATSAPNSSTTSQG